MAKSDNSDHVASHAHGYDSQAAKLDKADHITFTRIASTDTEIPDQPGSNFLYFDTFPSVDKEGEVAFGQSLTAFGNVIAIYVGSGGELQLVADVNTLLPGNPGPIVRFDGPVIGDSVVAFVARGGEGGVYSWEAGSINVTVVQSTVLPDGSQRI
jgi:hypothetical protein